MIPGDITQRFSACKAEGDIADGNVIAKNDVTLCQGLRESEETSTASLTVETSARNVFLQHVSAIRQHNYRYGEGADSFNELCSSPNVESHCSTVIESCSLTESSLTSPSPFPWSPLGRHPAESRCARLRLLLEGKPGS